MRQVLLTHAEWCRHLSLLGQLKDEHRVCLKADRCIAGRVPQDEAS